MVVGQRINVKKTLPIFLIVIAFITIAVLLYHHYSNHLTPAQKKQAAINSNIQSSQLNVAQSSIDQKKYAEAISSYEAAAAVAEGTNDYKKAEDILQDCISKIPDQYLTWDVYDYLANAAKQLQDTSLEKSSLEKALAKAQAPNSGAPDALVALYKKEISQLNQK